MDVTGVNMKSVCKKKNAKYTRARTKSFFFGLFFIFCIKDQNVKKKIKNDEM